MQKAIGYTDYTKTKKLSTDAIFAIGSISKLFTATAIYKLQEEGKIDINSSLDTYLRKEQYPKTWATWTSVVTVNQLLTHKSGLPKNLYDNESICYLFNHTLDPGRLTEHFQRYDNKLITHDLTKDNLSDTEDNAAYSNFGYNILAVIIENISNMSYADYIIHTFCKPLSLKNTFSADSTTISLKQLLHETSPIAAPCFYSFLFNKYNNQKNAIPSLGFDNFKEGSDINLVPTIGAGSIFSTASDLAQWTYSIFYSDLILKTRQAKESLKNFALKDHIWGLQGHLPGYNATLFHRFTDAATVIVLSNLDRYLQQFNYETNMHSKVNIDKYHEGIKIAEIENEFATFSKNRLFIPLNIAKKLFDTIHFPTLINN